MAREKQYPRSDLQINLGDNNEFIEPFAHEVAIKRGEEVAIAMFHIAAIRSLYPNETTMRNAPISCVKAHVQHTSATKGHQAAHLLPGQILVKSKPVWRWACVTNQTHLASDLRRLELQTKSCFAKTTILPALFNRADSPAENGVPVQGIAGLKNLFEKVVQKLWRSARVDKSRPLFIDRQATLNALNDWFISANQAYTAAAIEKRNKARTITGTKSEERIFEARVLEAYADSFIIASPSRFVCAHLDFLNSYYAHL